MLLQDVPDVVLSLSRPMLYRSFGAFFTLLPLLLILVGVAEQPSAILGGDEPFFALLAAADDIIENKSDSYVRKAGFLLAS